MNGQCPICRLRIDTQYPPEGGMDGKSPELQTSEKH